jgi:hypothetical protein
MASNDKRVLVNRLSGTAGRGTGANTGLGTADVIVPEFPRLPSRLTEDSARQFRQEVERWRTSLQGQFPIPTPEAFDPSAIQAQIDSALATISQLQSDVDALPDEVSSGLRETITIVTAGDLTEIRNQIEIIQQQISAPSSQFVFNQGSPASLWTITHNLGGYPSVTVADSAGSVGYGAVKYIDPSSLTVEFASSFSGRAYLIL